MTISDKRTIREAEALEKKNGRRIEETTIEACRIFLAAGDATPRVRKAR